MFFSISQYLKVISKTYTIACYFNEQISVSVLAVSSNTKLFRWPQSSEALTQHIFWPHFNHLNITWPQFFLTLLKGTLVEFFFTLLKGTLVHVIKMIWHKKIGNLSWLHQVKMSSSMLHPTVIEIVTPCKYVVGWTLFLHQARQRDIKLNLSQKGWTSLLGQAMFT